MDGVMYKQFDKEVKVVVVVMNGVMDKYPLHWYLLVPTVTLWYQWELTGTRWYSLVPFGTRWNPLVLVGTHQYLLVVDALDVLDDLDALDDLEMKSELIFDFTLFEK